MINAGLFTSLTPEWETPQDLYDRLDEEFHFDLDPCATDENHKCRLWFTREQDGLLQPWAPQTVYMNPPYGREVGIWVKKAYEESQKGCTVVCLLPARTDTRWFHAYCMKAEELRFIKGRLHFGGSENSAPFPSMIVVFSPGVYMPIILPY